MSILLFLLASPLAITSPTIQLPERIFIERLQESNWVQYDLTCFRGVAADRKKKCTLSKKISGNEVVTTRYEYKAAVAILKDFFSEVSVELGNFQDAETSDRMKWELKKSDTVFVKGSAGNDHSTLRPDLNSQRELLRTKLRTIIQLFESYLLVNSSRK